MEKKADIQFVGNTCVLTGELCLANSMAIYHKSLAGITARPSIIVDFSGLTSSDSSGIALILEWMKFARRKDIGIQFINLSQDLMAIAHAANVDKIIDGIG